MSELDKTLAELAEAKAEILRLREALEAVCAADCCGCAVYEKIARAALNGVALDAHGGPCGAVPG